MTLTLASIYLVVAGCAIAIVIEVGKRLLPESVLCSAAWARCAPLLPLVLGIAVVCLLGRHDTLEGHPIPWVALVCAGIATGGLSGHLYKVALQTVRGEDRRIHGGER